MIGPKQIRFLKQLLRTKEEQREGLGDRPSGPWKERTWWLSWMDPEPGTVGGKRAGSHSTLEETPFPTGGFSYLLGSSNHHRA